MLLCISLLVSLGAPPDAVQTKARPETNPTAERARLRTRRAAFGVFGGLSLGAYVATTGFFLATNPGPTCGAFRCIGAALDTTEGTAYLTLAHVSSGAAMGMFGGAGAADGALDANYGAPVYGTVRPWMEPALLVSGITSVVVGAFVGVAGLRGWRGNQFIGASVMAIGTATGTAGAYFVGRRRAAAQHRRSGSLSISPTIGTHFGGLHARGRF